MKKRLTSTAFAGSLLLSPAVASAAGEPPFFIVRTPETVIVNLNLGQNSFECTGTARDFDPFDQVYISTAILPSFMTLDVTTGNPASFRLYGENLTIANRGGYLIDVIASDSLTNLSNVNSIRFSIGIIPEPSSVALLFSVAALLGHRRRNH